nr:hypothetical protein [Clostridium sp. AM30-24]
MTIPQAAMIFLFITHPHQRNHLKFRCFLFCFPVFQAYQIFTDSATPSPQILMPAGFSDFHKKAAKPPIRSSAAVIHSFILTFLSFFRFLSLLL